VSKAKKVPTSEFPNDVLQSLADYIRESRAKSEDGRMDRAGVLQRFNRTFSGRGYRLTIGKLAALYRRFGKAGAVGAQEDFLKKFPPVTVKKTEAPVILPRVRQVTAPIERPPKPVPAKRRAAPKPPVAPQPKILLPEPIPIPAPEPVLVVGAANDLRGAERSLLEIESRHLHHDVVLMPVQVPPREEPVIPVVTEIAEEERETPPPLPSGPKGKDEIIADTLVEWERDLSTVNPFARAAIALNIGAAARGAAYTSSKAVEAHIKQKGGIKPFLLGTPAFVRRFAEPERVAKHIVKRADSFE